MMQEMDTLELVDWMARGCAHWMAREPPLESTDADARRGYWYVATPYTLYPYGMEAAFKEACRAAAWLILHGVSVSCPIVESHPIAQHGGLDPLDQDAWWHNNRPKIEAAMGIVICKMESWRVSAGILWERDLFRDAGKPVVYLEWPEGRLTKE